MTPKQEDGAVPPSQSGRYRVGLLKAGAAAAIDEHEVASRVVAVVRGGRAFLVNSWFKRVDYGRCVDGTSGGARSAD